MKLFLCLTLLGGSIFLWVQAVEYSEAAPRGFNPHVSLFGSVFFTTTGFHGFHVFCGVVCIAFVTGKAFSASTRRSPPGDRDDRPLLAFRRPRLDRALHDHLSDLDEGEGAAAGRPERSLRRELQQTSRAQRDC